MLRAWEYEKTEHAGSVVTLLAFIRDVPGPSSSYPGRILRGFPQSRPSNNGIAP
jgi:hypothetical protein